MRPDEKVASGGWLLGEASVDAGLALFEERRASKTFCFSFTISSQCRKQKGHCAVCVVYRVAAFDVPLGDHGFSDLPWATDGLFPDKCACFSSHIIHQNE